MAQSNGSDFEKARGRGKSSSTGGRATAGTGHSHWRDAVQTLMDLQTKYQDGLDNLPVTSRRPYWPNAWRQYASTTFGDLKGPGAATRVWTRLERR